MGYCDGNGVMLWYLIIGIDLNWIGHIDCKTGNAVQ